MHKASGVLCWLLLVGIISGCATSANKSQAKPTTASNTTTIVVPALRPVPTDISSNKSENCLFYARPIYPRKAMVRGIEGWVVLQYTVEKSGKLKEAKILDSSPEGFFEQEALKMVNRYNQSEQPWTFDNSDLVLEKSIPTPRQEHGEAVEIPGCINILQFKLEG